MALFTPEELEELRQADAEIDENFEMTHEEYLTSRKRDLTHISETEKQKRKEYYAKNREKLLRKTREYHYRIMPNGKTWRQNYRDAHRDEINARQRARYRANPNYSKEYQEKNREKLRAYNREYQRNRRRKEENNE